MHPSGYFGSFDKMPKLDYTLMPTSGPADTHDQSAIGGLYFELMGVGVQPRHRDLIAITQIADLGVAMSLLPGLMPPAGKQ